MPNSLEHISTQTVTGSTVNAIGFTGLSATYQQFAIKGYFCSNSNSTSNFSNMDWYIRLNGDRTVSGRNWYQRSAATQQGNPNGGNKYYYNNGGTNQFQLTGPREKYNSNNTMAWQPFEMDLLPGSNDDVENTIFYHMGSQNNINQDITSWLGTGRYYSYAATGTVTPITSVYLYWNGASDYYKTTSYFSLYGIKES